MFSRMYVEKDRGSFLACTLKKIGEAGDEASSYLPSNEIFTLIKQTVTDSINSHRWDILSIVHCRSRAPIWIGFRMAGQFTARLH